MRRRLVTALVLGAIGFAAGGLQASGSGLRPGSWTVLPAPGNLWGGHSATVLKDGRVLVAGGNYSSPKVIPDARIFSPVTNTWSPVASMSQPRSNHTATLLADGSVLVAGGWGGGANAERYDPASGTWHPAGTMHEERISQIASLLPNGKVLVVGGLANRAMGALITSTDIYDPASGKWTPGPELLQGRAEATATKLGDGNLLVAGGRGAAHDPSLRDVLLFNSGSGTFSVLPQLLDVERGLHSANLLADGRVMLIGGLKKWISYFSSNLLSSTDFIDPAKGSISPGPSMRDGRWYHASVMLPDGRILVAGGYGLEPGKIQQTSAATPLLTTELYSPATNSWSPGTPLPHLLGSEDARLPITATLLDQPPCGSDCGKVLFIGGNVALLYDPTKGKVVPATPAPGGFLHSITSGAAKQVKALGTTETLAIAGGAVLLLAALAVVVVRRRRR